MIQGQHLHLDDHPQTLRLLGALLARRSDREDLGYSATEHGAFVDWERLSVAGLSSTEVATVHVARGCAALERAGGAPPHLADVVVDVVRNVV